MYKHKSLLINFICFVKIILLVLILFEIDFYYKLNPNNLSNERLKQFFEKINIENKTSSETNFRSKDTYIKANKIANEKYLKQDFKKRISLLWM